MVNAGEAGGILEETLRRVATQLEKDESLRRQVKSAMMYPAFITFFAFVVLIALLTFLVPVFAGILKAHFASGVLRTVNGVFVPEINVNPRPDKTAAEAGRTALDLVAIDSGVTHRHAGGAYATRRRESEAAAQLLGVASLRDVSCDDLDRVDRLPPPLNRRARHIITENRRVLDARDAVRSGNLEKLGSLFFASHDSLRDDYEVSVAAIERLINIARRHPRVLGARMTGGGFGGVVILVARTPFGSAVSRDVSVAYSDTHEYRATVLLPIT